MFLYLVRHADAKTEQEDPLRPLSESGLRDIKKMASYLSHMNIKIDEIFHSRKLRARQTAEVLYGHLKPAKGISESDGLDPGDNPGIWSARLKDMSDNITLVGHLPHLGRLASLLLCGDMDKNIIEFKSAGIACLKRDDYETWSLQWMLVPDAVFLPG